VFGLFAPNAYACAARAEADAGELGRPAEEAFRTPWVPAGPAATPAWTG
jgi:hypothetical protein